MNEELQEQQMALQHAKDVIVAYLNGQRNSDRLDSVRMADSLLSKHFEKVLRMAGHVKEGV